ncbi:MAG: site-2 protease family protein [Candidatus Paceibacterota bacterium]|jgi:Zn-dependent protease
MLDIFSIIILIASVVIHEVAHGVTALYFGDETAKRLGRLTLNPLKHVDPIGSVFLPLIMIVLNTGIVFGWAKPVPYNPYNLRNRRFAEPMVALAGPLSNIILAVIFGLAVRFLLPLGTAINQNFVSFLGIIALINLALAIFNLVPVPPLDGSKILFALLPPQYEYVRVWLEKNGFVLVLIFILFLWKYLIPVIAWLFSLLVGA